MASLRYFGARVDNGETVKMLPMADARHVAAAEAISSAGAV
jgi:hypothetical protein